MSTKTIKISIDDLIDKFKKYNDNEEDIALIRRAYDYAEKKHFGQKRISGDDYILHPLNVALILTEISADAPCMAAALLHDTIEDSDATKEEIEELFGSEVALLVDGVTKINKLNFNTETEASAANQRKILVGLSEDPRVIIIKLADRLHNMRTISVLSVEKQKKKAKETLEILTPVAHRLGIYKIKSELEDLSLRYLKPDAYFDIVEKLNQKKTERDEAVSKMIDEVSELLNEHNIPHEIKGRSKSIYSIYNKMAKGKRFDDIYDILALRVFVDTEQDCYLALGLIHSKYKPVPKRFKDYIAMPKANMYQSLHTTLIGPSGQPFEIQIRTEEMHKTAEYGIAAHWKYKETGGSNTKGLNTQEEKLNWLRQILEWQRDMSDNREFLSLLKGDLDLFQEDVYCFTPNGDVKNLPNGSTPVDFAYAIHSAVGNKMVGARVNGKLVNIDYKIQNGDRIEILTSQNSKGPSRDWLNIVKSTQAKSKINSWFKKEYKEDNIIRGKDLISAYCKSKGINLPDIIKPKYQQIVQKKYGFRDWDAVLAAIGHGGLKEGQVVNRLLEEYEKEHKKEITDENILEKISEANKQRVHTAKSKSGIVVKGINDMAVRFSKCCNPVPGDEIVGFVTRGRGMSIHRTDCINIINLSDVERSRLITAEWEDNDLEEGGQYLAELKIFADDRRGLLLDVSKVFTEEKIDVKSMNTRTSKKGTATMEMGFVVHGREELNRVIGKLRQIENVIDIERTTG